MQVQDLVHEGQNSADLYREIQVLRADLTQKFQQGSWNELSHLLETVAQVGQSQGQRELCLRAQSLRELMGVRAGGRAPGARDSGDRLSQVFNEMMFHLSHFQWLSQ